MGSRRYSGALSAGLFALATLSFHTNTAHSQELKAALEESSRAAAAARLAPRLDDVVAEHRSGLKTARVGIAVMDVQSGAVLYQRDGDALFNTASNTKIVTTAAALKLLGPDYRFSTTLFAEEVDDKGVIKGDLYLQGHGNPSFGTLDLYDLARDLSRAGIKRIRGGIVVDQSFFDGANTPPHFDEQPDEQAAFRAPIGATSLNFNSVTVTVRPSRVAGKLATISVEPPSDYVSLDTLVHTVKSGRTRLRVEAEARRGTLHFKISGQIRVEAPVRRIRRRVPEPDQYVGKALRQALKTYRISVGKKTVVVGAVPEAAQPIAESQSPPLAVLVRGMGKYSNNYVAEMLLKTIGAEVVANLERPATWDDGIKAVHRFLREDIGLDESKFRYQNGSGLFDSNSFTPVQMVKILSAAYRDYRYGPDLVASLSIAATDGTLRRRMEDSPAEKLVRAKTGTLATVSALSGFAAVDGRRPLAFAIFVNDFPEGRTGLARTVQDQLATAMVEYLEHGQRTAAVIKTRRSR